MAAGYTPKNRSNHHAEELGRMDKETISLEVTCQPIVALTHAPFSFFEFITQEISIPDSESFESRIEAIKDTILVWMIREDADVRYSTGPLNKLSSHTCAVKQTISMGHFLHLMSLLVDHSVLPNLNSPQANSTNISRQYHVSPPQDDLPYLSLLCSCSPTFLINQDHSYDAAHSFVEDHLSHNNQSEITESDVSDALLVWLIREDASISVHNKMLEGQPIYPPSLSYLLQQVAREMHPTLEDNDHNCENQPDCANNDQANVMGDTIVTSPSPPTQADADNSDKSVLYNPPSTPKAPNFPPRICTRGQHAHTAALIQQSSKARQATSYLNTGRHMPGEKPKTKAGGMPRYNKSKIPSHTPVEIEKWTEDLRYLQSLHVYFLSCGLSSPRDSWRCWIDDNLTADCDRAFMCLVVILMSSSTSDRQLATLVPRIFQSGFVSSKATIEIAQNFGMDMLCSLLSESGRYFQNAENIVNAADYFLQNHNGIIPSTITVDELVTIHGIGYKTATIVLDFAFDRNDGIPTDVHVLRCSIALGWIPKTISDPDLGSCILESWLPKDEWQAINPMFGSFGQLLQNPATRWKCTDAHMDFTVRRLDKDRHLPNKKQIYNLYNNFIRIYRSYSI